MADASRSRALAVFVLLVAFIARAWTLWQLQGAPFFHHPLPGMDQATYLKAAGAITGGDLIARGLGVSFAPLYAYFVALIHLLGGERVWPIYLAQAVLGLCTVGLVFGMARRWFGNLAGASAGLLYGLYGPALYFESQVLEASLAAFAVALGLYAHQRLAWGGRAVPWAATAGASLGLVMACWPRGGWLLIPSLWSLWRQTGQRSGARRGRALAGYALALLLLTVPVVARSYVLDGSYLPSRREVGELLLGNLPDKAQAGWAGSPSFSEFAKSHPIRLRPVLGELLSRVLREPLAYGRLEARKAVETLGDHEIPANDSYALSASHSWLLRMPWCHFALLLGLGFIGAVASWRGGARLPVAWIAAAAFGTFLLIPDSRTRLPWIPILVLLAGAGVAALVDLVRPVPRALPRAVPAIGLALLIGSFLSAPAQPVREVDYLNAAGYYLSSAGNLAALLGTPPNEARDRELEAAETDLERARDLVLRMVPPCRQPTEVGPARLREALVRALSGLSMIHQDEGDGKAALTELNGILWLVPGLIPERVNSALLHKYQSEPEELVRELQIAAILSPDDPRVHENLAIAFGSVNAVKSPPRSHFHLRRMLELNPNHPAAAEYLRSLQKLTAMLAGARSRVDLGQMSSTAYQLAAEGQPERAIAAFRDVFKYDTSNPADFEQVAGLYLSKGNYRGAADNLLDAAVMQPERAELLVQLADLYERLHYPTLALEFLRRAATQDGVERARVKAAVERLNGQLVGLAWVPPGTPTPCGPAPPLPSTEPPHAK